MAGEELWRYQGGSDGWDYAYGAAALSDGSFVVAGSTDSLWNGSHVGDADLVAVKISSEGTFLWAWQGGSNNYEELRSVVALEDDSVIVAGYVRGEWNGVASFGSDDFAAIRIHSNGTMLWSWREGSSENDHIFTASGTADGNVVLAGETAGNFARRAAGYQEAAAVKLDANGTVLWRWQNGTDDGGGVSIKASAARPDGSVVLSGTADGSWRGALSFESTSSFVAVALDEHGAELWRWQDGTNGSNYINAATAIADGSVVLAGYTTGNWSGRNLGEKDCVAVKLDVFGVETWRWQDGTRDTDNCNAVASDADGSIIVAGYTTGNWGTINEGGFDFFALALDADGEVLWTYQEGTMAGDSINAAAVREDGAVLLAGSTSGSWNIADADGENDVAAVLLNTGVATTTQPPTALGPTTTQPPTALEPVTTSHPTALQPATATPFSVHSSAPSRSPAVPSTSSSGSSPKFNPVVVVVAVVGVVASLAVIGACIFRRRKTKRKVVQACYPQAVTPPPQSPPSYPQAVTPLPQTPPCYPQAVTPPSGSRRRHKPILRQTMPPPAV